MTALHVTPHELVSTATPFTLTSQTGASVRLGDALGHGDVVLVFYRGHW